MELARQAALRLNALMYTWNLMSSGILIEIGTWLLIIWLVMFIIFFIVHPGHKSSPYPFLLIEGFVFGLLITSLWTGRVQIFLRFNYAATPPADMLLQATFAIPTYEFICVGFVVLIVIFSIFTWFKVIKFKPVT